MNRFHCLSAVLISLLPATAAHAGSSWDANKAVMSAALDLDGDGKTENIRLAPFNERDAGGRWDSHGKFGLTVNGQTVFNRFVDSEAKIEGFFLADIDRTDREKEIVVHAFVPEDYSADIIYRYDGRKLHRVGEVSGEWAKFQGDGVVLESQWHDFWQYDLKYVLRHHKLVLVPQKLYPLKVNGQVNQPLALYRRRNKKRVVATLPKGRKVVIIQGDLKGWYQVQSSGGSRGWIKEDQVFSHLDGIPRAG